MTDEQVIPVSTGSDPTSIAHPMAGHLGNLTDQQERVFSTFKENLIKANLYTTGSENHEASHDDPTLLYAISLNILPPLQSNSTYLITVVS
jgi:SHS2 domain-containing protein